HRRTTGAIGAPPRTQSCRDPGDLPGPTIRTWSLACSECPRSTGRAVAGSPLLAGSVIGSQPPAVGATLGASSDQEPSPWGPGSALNDAPADHPTAGAAAAPRRGRVLSRDLPVRAFVAPHGAPRGLSRGAVGDHRHLLSPRARELLEAASTARRRA